jgi:hypothetical protein
MRPINVSLEISDDQVEEIILESLKQDVQVLKSFHTDDVEFLQCLLKVIQYYSSKDDFEEYIKSVGIEYETSEIQIGRFKTETN